MKRWNVFFRIVIGYVWGLCILFLLTSQAFCLDQDSPEGIKKIVSEFIHSLDPDHACSCEHHTYNHKELDDLEIDHVCECSKQGCHCHDICDHDEDHGLEAGFIEVEEENNDKKHIEHVNTQEHSKDHHNHHPHHHHHHLNNSNFVVVVGSYLKDTAKHIKEAVDIKELSWKVRRYVSMNRDASAVIKKHLLNLMFIWPMSESLEVLSAPIVGTLGVEAQLPSYILIPTVGVLSLVALPGICPLCTLLLMVYPLRPVHESITKIRQLLTKVLTYKIPYTDRMSFFKTQDRILYLQGDRDHIVDNKSAFLTVSSSSIEGFIIQDGDIEQILEVIYFYDGSDSYISSLRLSSKFQELDPLIRKKIIKELGSNIYSFSKKAGFLEKLYKSDENYIKDQFFVENFENKEDLYIAFKRTSMFLSKKVSIGCSGLFSQHQ